MTTVDQRRFTVASADAMRDLGADIGALCAGGDVIVLVGDLGAGKTTFTQGVARGLGIDEAVTSPTFVIARVHPGAAVDLVHVDAYRLGSAVELDALDLDADLDHSVVVIEWGAGLADDLSDSRIEISIERSPVEEDETRIVTVAAAGERWRSLLDSGESVT